MMAVSETLSPKGVGGAIVNSRKSAITTCSRTPYLCRHPNLYRAGSFTNKISWCGDCMRCTTQGIPEGKYRSSKPLCLTHTSEQLVPSCDDIGSIERLTRRVTLRNNFFSPYSTCRGPRVQLSDSLRLVGLWRYQPRTDRCFEVKTPPSARIALDLSLKRP